VIKYYVHAIIFVVPDFSIPSILSSFVQYFPEKWKAMITIPDIIIISITRIVYKYTTLAILFVTALVGIRALGQLECFII